MERFEQAFEDLRQGRPVLVYVKDQNEVSLFASGKTIDHGLLSEMKRTTTSDVLITVSTRVAESLGLDLLSDILEYSYDKFPNTKKLVKKIKPWALPIDHVNVLTGSSDEDKLMTIHRMTEIVEKETYDKFLDEFNAPGHLRVFVSHRDLFEARSGHTELSIGLMQLANLPEVAVISSMKDLVTDERLSTEDAIKYAKNRGIIYLEEQEIVDYYNSALG